ncbi:Succinyl-CoA:coenzyme A transferase [Legionella massiliensis]|uniref:Succinyl-CoA:coenzyme A transferase n=1 Tax=Legionella massiliensis TaxID=1034943 RepID=A0A078KRZ2_9GAMM|nr:acetyl-CoA hydrolase/transferase C-terminal domain-containing protein [Legionella massiliensis]CDZ77230.1 Succinyl-CoA:coenzyme A transferase [Legionella massiliensis]CEE12968.1 Succinyl-CoA:coenzyme A transferase [Legionella massiliensis]
MFYDKLYQSKLVTAEQAVERINNNSTLVVAMGAGAPPALLSAIAQRVLHNDLQNLSVYYKIATRHLADTLLTEKVLEKIRAHSFFVAGIDHNIIKEQQQTGKKLLSFVPCNFSQIPRVLREIIKVNTFIITVSPMDSGGYFSMGTNNDYASTAVRQCDQLLLEVNPNMPRVFGQSQIHVSQAAAIVENTAPLIEFPSASPSEKDIKIGKLVAPLVPDGATIQLGIGKVPEGIARALEGHKNLGIHTELFSNAMTQLIHKGVINGNNKFMNPQKHVFTVALGDKNTYEYMNNNSAMESYSSEYVNGINTIALQNNFVSINTAISVDLYGQVNAEFIEGHEYSGSGGQFDFVKGAALAKNGISVIALHSSAKNGAVSTIVPKVEMVTDVRMDVEYIVTENGIVNLRGKSTKERALALIEIADPKFQEELIQAAQKLTLI